MRRIRAWLGSQRRTGRLDLAESCSMHRALHLASSGVIPDIPWLRRGSDVAQLTTIQRELLDALWPLLEVGGRLLYVVCSLFPEEGREQIARFLASGTRRVPMHLPASQLLPYRPLSRLP